MFYVHPVSLDSLPAAQVFYLLLDPCLAVRPITESRVFRPPTITFELRVLSSNLLVFASFFFFFGSGVKYMFVTVISS